MMNNFLTLRFSGCGHLLPYHLGVSSVFLEEASKQASYRNRSTDDQPKCTLPRIKAVSGSSAGAIAAVLHARLPHRVEEFATKFISDRGNALKTLTSMLHEEENSHNLLHSAGPAVVLAESKKHIPPSLHVATTKCIDGSHHSFDFSGCIGQYSSISSSWTTDKMLEAVKASCTIPPSFHPADIILQSQQNSYPDSEGILLSDGNYHVDGGIAAPAPPTPRDSREGACPIIISPISAGAPFFFPRERETMRISPVDDSWRLLPISNLICRGDFDVKPSIQNLRALRMASGLVSSKELEGWFQQGIDDALRVVKIWK